MFKSLSIKNFRTFRDFSIQGLGRINLIAGQNNVGKTALLEALYLLLGETNLSLVLNINTFRGLDKLQGDTSEISDWVWSHLFYRFETDQTIDIEGRWEDDSTRRLSLKLVPRTALEVSMGPESAGKASGGANGFATRELEIGYSDGGREQRSARMQISVKGVRVEPPPPAPALPGYFLGARGSPSPEEDARNFGQLEVQKEPYDLLESLRIIEPRLTRLRTVIGAGGTLIYGDVGLPRMLPLGLLGDGLNRLASILVKIATAPHGAVLVDEIENGLHYSVLKKVWAAIADAARRFSVQIFATTHSWECLWRAHEVAAESEAYDFRFHRLQPEQNRIRAVTLDREAFEASVAMGLEVR